MGNKIGAPSTLTLVLVGAFELSDVFIGFPPHIDMSDFNKDELDPPSWINEAFVEQVLSASEGDNTIKVNKLEITPGSAKGDHYASIMFRVKATYETKSAKANSVSLILKTLPETDCHKNEMFGGVPIFETEIGMYSRIIPTFEDELRKIGDNTVLGARAVHHFLEPRKCIIFEDLVEKGYTAIRGRLLNITETKAALLKLAKWHAASYKLAAQGDVPVTAFKGGFFSRNDIDSLPMMSSGLKNFIKTVEKIDELKVYLKKLKEIPKDFLKQCMSLVLNSETQKEPKVVSVLCHGDFHSRNMMFKHHADGKLDDVMLLDFQISFFGPAVMDLMYALYLLVDHDIRTNHREELISYYATNFIETLKRMNHQGVYPKISDFYIDMFRFRHWELFLITSILPMLYAMIYGSVEIEEVVATDDGYEKQYENPVYVRELKSLVPKLYYMGYFE